MNRDQVLGIARHVLTFVSGLAIGQGWMDESMSGEVMAVGLGLVGLVWSFVDKR